MKETVPQGDSNNNQKKRPAYLDPVLDLPQSYTCGMPEALKKKLKGHERSVRMARDSLGAGFFLLKRNTLGLNKTEEKRLKYFREQFNRDRLNHPEWPPSRR